MKKLWRYPDWDLILYTALGLFFLWVIYGIPLWIAVHFILKYW